MEMSLYITGKMTTEINIPDWAVKDIIIMKTPTHTQSSIQPCSDMATQEDTINGWK